MDIWGDMQILHAIKHTVDAMQMESTSYRDDVQENTGKLPRMRA